MEYCTTRKPKTIIQKKKEIMSTKTFFRKILGPPGDILWDPHLEGPKIF